MAQSGTVAFETPFTAEVYNDLRDDILSATLGHRHTGAEGDGRRLVTNSFQPNSIPASKIANRTRRFFVQAISGWDSSNGSKLRLRYFCKPGITLENGVTAYAEGRFVLPPDRTADEFTIRPVLIAGYSHYRRSPALAIYIQTDVEIGTFGTQTNSESNTGTATQFYPDWWYFNLNYGPSTDITGITTSDPVIVTARLWRYGAHAQDTSTFQCHVLGWLVEYTAGA